MNDLTSNPGLLAIMGDSPWFAFFVVLILGSAITLAHLAALGYAVFYLVSLPMRRNERTRFLLHLWEQALLSGRQPETVLRELAAVQDRTLGVRIHLLAAYVESGLTLEQALEKVPSVLPSDIRAALRSGMQVGDLEKVLPACRRMLGDGISKTLGTYNYLVIVLLVVTPAVPVIFNVLQKFVLPKFPEIFAGFTAEYGGDPSPFFMAIAALVPKFAIILEVVSLILFLTAVGYIGGHWIRDAGRFISVKATDALPLLFPWKRKRMIRNFAELLGVFLDAGVPEKLAVERASSAVDNFWFGKKATQTVAALQSGLALPAALRFLDRNEELQWRMENAAHGKSRFQNSLKGWIGFLDAKAFQQEQAFAQVLSTVLVLFNGLFIGLLIGAIFSLLFDLIAALSL